MATNGNLNFTNVNKVTFEGVGAAPNAVIDTTTGKIGVGVDSPAANLHVVGNCHVSTNMELGGTLVMGTVTVEAQHALSAITATGNTTPHTVEFQNAATSLVTTGNVQVGKELHMQYTDNVAKIQANSNVVTEFSRSKKLIKYPRVALTQNALNNGYTVSASSQESTNRQAWKVFNNTYEEGDGWRSWGQTYSSSDGSFTGTFVDFSNGGQTFAAADQGQWVKITLPEKMRLERFRLQPRFSDTTGGATYSYGRSEFVKNGAIWGSNDGSSWERVYTITYGVPATDTTIAEFTVPNSTTAYNNFVLVVTDTHGSAAGLRAGLSEWELLGVPESDPEAHGTDVVVKSVPNVPNTDFLDVFVDAGNTSGYELTGSSVTTVLDLSPDPNTMSVTGVTYDSTNKAFVFSGSSSSYIKATLQNGNGNYAHTLSAWFMMTDYSSSWRSIIGLGTNTPSGQQSAIAYDPDQDQLYFGTYGADIYVPHKPELYKWYHVAATFTGGDTTSISMNLYLNGVNMGGVPDGTQEPQFTGDQLCIGGTMNSGGTQANNPFKGQIANARFYRRAYTSEEIYQLYAHQKEEFGNSTNNLTLKAGRLGIGTSEPKAALDVRGDMYGGCPVFFTAYAGNNGTVTGSSTGTVIVFNTTTVNKGGAYDTSNGRCTFPVSGYYEVFFRGSTAGTADFHAKIYRNGNAPGSGGWTNHLPRLWDASDSQYRNAGTIQFFDYFEAGEYIEVRLTNFSVFNADNYNSFSVKYLSN